MFARKGPPNAAAPSLLAAPSLRLPPDEAVAHTVISCQRGYQHIQMISPSRALRLLEVILRIPANVSSIHSLSYLVLAACAAHMPHTGYVSNTDSKGVESSPCLASGPPTPKNCFVVGATGSRPVCRANALSLCVACRNAFIIQTDLTVVARWTYRLVDTGVRAATWKPL